MAKKRKATSSHDTPVMRQFREVKGRYPDALLFFRMGDFYEMFYDDAVVSAKELGLALTSRDKGRDDAVPMCGVPHHSVKTYVHRLLERGHKVAVCEQLEDPSKAKGIVARDVVRVITPGSNVDTELLEAGQANYLACVVPEDPDAEGGACGLAAADISTGEMIVVEAADATELAGELARLDPREILVPPSWSRLEAWITEHVPRASRTPYPDTRDFMGAGRAAARIKDVLVDVPFDGLSSRGLAAAASVLDYLARTQPGLEIPIRRLVPLSTSDHLVLDDNTIRHLELVTSVSGEKRASLVGWMDRTCTAMGSRLLRGWVLAPLLDVAAIRRRQDGVEAFVNDARAREEIQRLLGGACDVERVLSRVVLEAASPRELGALRNTMRLVPRLDEALASLADPGAEPPVVLPPAPADVQDVLERALVDEPPLQSKEGGIFRRSWNEELDRLVELSTSGKDAITRMEAEERETTGIGSLKIKYNRVFGYFIEVTKPNLNLVPEDRYIRKQTLATGERYLTPELKDLEAQILTADERRKALEVEMFRDLLTAVSEHEAGLRACGESLARLDVLTAFAALAARHGYVRPRVVSSGRTMIRSGRHPVVEAFGAPDGFVPNDVDLDVEHKRLWIITGPNMSGKSTFMRQVALSAIMAQAGSFIPVAEAEIGLSDRIFTRVGASDNLAWGQSTFMVEMTETASILKHATRRSLVVLDEVGRGTSTFDGMSIAWAVAEHLHDAVGARTLFATHYHELTELASTHAHVANYNVTAAEYGGGVVFLRKVEPGSASRSYGIQVARLAGVPEPVLGRAQSILDDLESGRAVTTTPPGPPPQDQLSLFAAPPRVPGPIRNALEDVDVDNLTPVEALNLLAKLKEMV
ncbi:MAG: DNA mismatch repair protein MutS [Deltaproteobacteria bacterium]|nr:DNA mismatch repair protein MutS [Deltaproteobacteria bacterium]